MAYINNIIMAIRIPQSKIKFNYTSGKEYFDKKTYKEYQGSYYEFNGRIFAGKEFNSNSPVLLPIPKGKDNLPFDFNKLLTQAATFIYAKVSKNKLPNNTFISVLPPSIDIKEILDDDPTNDNKPSFFCKKITTGVIKEIDETAYLKLKSEFEP
jgi:hypothetical protein